MVTHLSAPYAADVVLLELLSIYALQEIYYFPTKYF